MLEGVEHLRRTITADLIDGVDRVGVMIECKCDDVVKAAEVYPVTGFRLLCKLDSTPVTECDAEATPVHGLYKLVELGVPVEKCATQGLGDVLGHIASDDAFVADELNVDDHRVAGDSEPCSPKIGLRYVEAVDDAVNVDVPTGGRWTPLDFGKRTSTRDTLTPESPSSKSSEGSIEPVKLCSKRSVVDLEGESEETDGCTGECIKDISSKHP